MAAIVKVLRNTELDASIKIKTDGDATAVITKEMLCFKPDPITCKIDETNESSRFQQLKPTSGLNILKMQWSGKSQEGHAVIYRGPTHDLEHQIMSVCVGDTCQFDLEGQDHTPDVEYYQDDIEFEITGSVTFYIRLRKVDYNHFAGEYGDYGAYEDDNVLGPKSTI